MTNGALAAAMGRLMAMPFFPTDQLVKLAVADEINAIAATDEQLEWLIRRVTVLFSQWPGLSEIRAVYCSRFKPVDGIEVYSGVYPDGIPPERPVLAPVPKGLPPGHVATADVEFDRKVQGLVRAKRFPGGSK